MTLAVTVNFVILGVVVIGAGLYIWTKQRQQPGLVLRLMALALLELAILSILVAVHRQPIILFLTLIPVFALIPVTFSLLVVTLRTRK